ncbi:hypothetical protein WOLCODRAFT_133060 [Wolfiporia cocos MD-104 SS10]|uniref:RING-type E3 ubiquitin transferase n=1 Tax=Wolfiporia cocos (strain MD-104) TaxID=742152 RepID=A0A2H3JYQ7_WOLCO|nr:hypothetical protein WOLCODRAFT_133060 [Wolfiporia cocos MD-104 SS10]
MGGVYLLTKAGDIGQSPRRNRSSLPSFLFITFVLFMLTNNRGEELDARYHYLRALDSLNHQISNYSAWLNGTASNFTLPSEDNTTMPLVDSFMQFGSIVDPHSGSYYSNLTGFWHGKVGFHNLTSDNATSNSWGHLAQEFVANTNMSALPELLGTWNWTAAEKLSISIGDKAISFTSPGHNDSQDIAIIHGKVELSHPHSSEELRLDFDGVHFVSNGSIYAYALPAGQRADLRRIPALVPSSHMNETAHAILTELSARIARLKAKIDSGSIESESTEEDDTPKTGCSFKLLGQVETTHVPQELMRELENEIEHPTGISTVKAPKLKLNGVLISQNCAMLFEIKDTTGLKSPQLYRKITTYAGISTLVYLALLALLSREMSRNSAPAALSRLSRYVFLSQSLIDAISFVGHITLAILADGRPSLAVLAPAGVACMLFVYEAQFSVSIGQVQAPEDATPTPPRPTPAPPSPAATPAPDASSATPAPTSAPTYPPTAPQPAPQPQPAAPSPAPTAPERPSFLRFLWNHVRTDPSARLWTTISVFLIVVFRLVIILSLPLFFVGSLYSFVWMVQIYRSARRGRSSGLSTEYLFGATVCRLYFALYFLGCPKNILDVEPRRWIYGIAALMFVQVSIIILQDRLGPTFFLLNHTIATKTYDYHPPMPLPDPESPEQSLGDCAICMDAIEVDQSMRRRPKSSDFREKSDVLGLASGARRTGGIFSAVSAVGSAGGRKNYSLAPCHHLFHTACLERWLAIKNICPQCRRPLPPL